MTALRAQNTFNTIFPKMSTSSTSRNELVDHLLAILPTELEQLCRTCLQSWLASCNQGRTTNLSRPTCMLRHNSRRTVSVIIVAIRCKRILSQLSDPGGIQIIPLCAEIRLMGASQHVVPPCAPPCDMSRRMNSGVQMCSVYVWSVPLSERARFASPKSSRQVPMACSCEVVACNRIT